MQQDDGTMKEMVCRSLIDQMAILKNPDLVFSVGEQVKVKGGDFRIKSFGKRFIILEGLPGTRIRK